ncbi:transglycosylase domain-containing protein [Cryptosporangium phraense]|uniref:Penicillin-binding protein n=1 Tax=Cryptosporangium phraense TaxID=2593070 RepID=A0A545AL72_9ACTN|nr:transglycosylase domain-containing protein [Cryptosporangium phraense]TQS41485.1 penicillin-binding protein [Cryptosporangium phraense]
MTYGHTPDDDPDVGGRSSSGGTVYGGSAPRGSGGGTVYGGGSSAGSSGTTYGSPAAGRGTTYGSSGGTTYGSSSAGSSGTTYGSSGGGTTYGSSSAGRGTTYGAAGGGTTYGSPGSGGTTYGASSGTTYGSTAVGDRPAGLGPRSRAAALEDDQLLPEVGGAPSGGGPKKPGRRKKVLIGLGIGTALCLLLGLTGGGVAYASVDLPNFPAASKTTQIQYSDGKTTFATFATENRIEVPLAKVPKYVQDAVIATEDPDFRENSGVSFRGTARAVWGLVKGDEGAGGGSTITQQYIRNALNLTRERSYSRKVKEIILARKLSSSWDKDTILKGYLNTIYFGRGAWGIQSASQAYFHKDIDKLSVAEGAVLAAVIKDPTNFDPTNNKASAEGRWTYVVDQMAKKQFITAADRQALTYPKVAEKPAATRDWQKGATGILGQKIESELKTTVGLTEQSINTGGYRVVTTINPTYQKAAEAASKEYLKGQDKDMATAMVSIDPATGMVRAYYGGDRGYGNLDLASSAAPHPAGSSMKPYVLAKGVEEGYSIDSLWDGTSGQTFPDRSTPLKNSDGDNSCGKQCSLTSATVKSLNTVYWALTYKVHASEVAKLAEKAGITRIDGMKTADFIKSDKLNSGLGIGQDSISVLDQAAGYATFANYGIYRQPYFIDKVYGADGKVVWDHADHVAPEVQAFSKDVGRDVSYVLQQVYGATNKKITDGREGAIKTGTQQFGNTDENAHAWMCGFTPQLASAVWVGSGTDKDIKLRDRVNGNIHVYGSGIPGKIWRDFMSAALKGTDKEDFESPLHAGDQPGNAPSEEPSPTPSDTPDEDDQNQDGQNGDGQNGDGQNGDGQNQDGQNPGQNPDPQNPDGQNNNNDGNPFNNN